MVQCDFCGGSTGGLPHKCKYCSGFHCSNHLLPENHNCTRIRQLRGFFQPRLQKIHKVRKNSPYRSSVNKTYEHSEVHTEMYHPSESKLNLHFRNPFKNLFSFYLVSEIKYALTQFCIALFIGLGLNYVYYQNLSLHYLFIEGVNDWFSALMVLLDFGVGGGYDLLYIIINGFFYYYLFSTTIKMVYATISNLNKKGTLLFIIGIAIFLFVIFKYFPNIIY